MMKRIAWALGIVACAVLVACSSSSSTPASGPAQGIDGGHTPCCSVPDSTGKPLTCHCDEEAYAKKGSCTVTAASSGNGCAIHCEGTGDFGQPQHDDYSGTIASACP